MIKIFTDFISFTQTWPAIFQGAAGSFLFWILLELIKAIVKHFIIPLKNLKPTNETLLQEYNYRKFTSRNGLLPMTNGFIFSISRSLLYLFYALIFISIAVLFGAQAPFTKGFLTVSAIYYLIKGVMWLEPRWSTSDTLKNWQRVAELEVLLFGKVDEDTNKYLETFKPNLQTKESQ